MSAEFYDILQAERDRDRVHRLYSADVRTARAGVLDIGAGTGTVTAMSLVESGAAVHAVEPTRAMRTALMTRLADMPADLRMRVTVHARALHDSGLRAVADVAICHNVIGCLQPTRRRTLWPAVAKALLPGGVLVLQLPPASLPTTAVSTDLPIVRVGEHEYGGRMVTSADGERIRAHFDYWVRGRAGRLRERAETFWMWPLSRAELVEEMSEHGFAALPDRGDDVTLAARHPGLLDG
ncbi:methyltransferase [Actinoallomurus purpureus]|uniref:class I SAM-dependent methyltransferase n=1 Tax=Actinoallomurus purpureus TaxID=478114 RepID=UPI00209294CD|nr:methyltransferase [Actinoallomurus purpureus]MCO6008016.1 methyltransferase [Actinoallomurus purpureus]